MTLLIDLANLVPEDFSQQNHPFTEFISSPDEFSAIVAVLAGVAGILSLTSAKSGALVGVLISVTTIPAAANIGVAAALGDSEEWVGAMGQLDPEPRPDRALRDNGALHPAPALHPAQGKAPSRRGPEGRRPPDELAREGP